MLKQLVSEHRLPLIAIFLSEDMLVNMGLSSMPPDGEFRHTSGLALPPLFLFILTSCLDPAEVRLAMEADKVV